MVKCVFAKLENVRAEWGPRPRVATICFVLERLSPLRQWFINAVLVVRIEAFTRVSYFMRILLRRWLFIDYRRKCIADNREFQRVFSLDRYEGGIIFFSPCQGICILCCRRWVGYRRGARRTSHVRRSRWKRRSPRNESWPLLKPQRDTRTLPKKEFVRWIYILLVLHSLQEDFLLRRRRAGPLKRNIGKVYITSVSSLL